MTFLFFSIVFPVRTFLGTKVVCSGNDRLNRETECRY
jgi:hypothetical protein